MSTMTLDQLTQYSRASAEAYLAALSQTFEQLRAQWITQSTPIVEQRAQALLAYAESFRNQVSWSQAYAAVAREANDLGVADYASRQAAYYAQRANVLLDPVIDT